MAKIRVTKDGSLTHWGNKFEPYGKRSAFPSWQAFVEFNQSRECSSPACTKKRRARAKYCALCSKFCTRFGDPRWRLPDRKEYRADLLLVKDVIDFNLDNIIVTDFVEKVSNLAYQGKQGMGIEWATWWSEIYDNFNKPAYQWKQTPLNLLTELVTLNSFYSRTGSQFIKSEKMWNYILASVFFRGVRNRLRPRASSKRSHKFGKYIFAVFGMYILKISMATDRNEIRKRIREQQLNEAVLKLPEDRERGE